MPAAVDGVFAKLERAHEHLDTFNTEVSSFVDADPGEIVSDIKPEGDGIYEVLISIQWQTSPPLQLSVLAGEIIYQARSALDHLVFMLSVAFSEAKVGLPAIEKGMSQFPIFVDRQTYCRSAPRYVKFIDPKAATVIKTLQPYATGNHLSELEPLWILSELSNIDKHRRLNLVGYPIGRVELVGDVPATILSQTSLITRPLKNPAPVLLCRIRPAPGTGISEVRVNRYRPSKIAFEEGIPLPEKYAGDTLQDILTVIETKVIPPLEPFLI